MVICGASISSISKFFNRKSLLLGYLDKVRQCCPGRRRVRNSWCYCVVGRVLELSNIVVTSVVNCSVWTHNPTSSLRPLRHPQPSTPSPAPLHTFS